MATLAEYFTNETRTQLARLHELLQDEFIDAAAVLRVARALRGTAQMAREERVYRGALMLEQAMREVAGGSLVWSDALREATRAATDDLRILAERREPEGALDARLAAARGRWADAGRAVGEAAPAASRAGASDAALRAYVAAEVEGITGELDSGLAALLADPMDREPLKAILRRQRALLGSARLDEFPVVAEILRAVEDVTRVVARLDVGVKQEWLDVFRVARDGLHATIGALQQGQPPPPTAPLARLRHMHAELLERYGVGEPVNPAAGAQEGLVPAVRREGEEPGAGVPDGVMPISDLEYRGAAALERALELRARIEAAVADDPDVRAAVEELFDLIRLARS
ncbi:MAG TPA: hypothetical protein VK939_14265 [Longimicrobiales bacterium]|nr:hypothetical protein [Longimicrobiales bacterium]